MRVLLVQTYKADRIDYDSVDEVWRCRGGMLIAEPGASKVFQLTESAKAINAALAEVGATDKDVLAITPVPSEVNGRDRGSTNYYVFLRDAPVLTTLELSNPDRSSFYGPD